jgi:hypothetical protein
MQVQVERSWVEHTEPGGQVPLHDGNAPHDPGGAPMRLLSEQSARLPTTAFDAMNALSSSRPIVVASNRAQLRRVPVVMRMPTAPKGPVDKASLALIFMRPVLLQKCDADDGDAAWRARVLELVRGGRPRVDRPARVPGARGDRERQGALVLGEEIDRRPAGVPAAGSSGLATAGKRKAGSRERKKRVWRADRMINRSPEIG